MRFSKACAEWVMPTPFRYALHALWKTKAKNFEQNLSIIAIVPALLCCAFFRNLRVYINF